MDTKTPHHPPNHPYPPTNPVFDLNTSSPSERKNLRCGICQDVFKSPKLLPCFHTFCRLCLEQLVSVKGTPFQCPSCRKMTHVPVGGASGFQTNMYISEAELERARDNVSLCRVHVNYDEPLTFFCVTCDDAICWRCKLTSHEGHRCEDLTKGDKRHRRLAGARRDLDDVMQVLEKTVSESEYHLKQIQRKKEVLVQQVQARHDSLVAMADRWKHSVLKSLDKNSEVLQARLTSTKDQLVSDLNTCRTQRKRVQGIMDDLSEDVLDVAEAERMLRTCSDSDSLRKRVKVLASAPAPSIFRPGLHCSVDGIREDDVKKFLGVATLLKLPSPGPARENITRFYQCLEDKQPRQIVALCVTNEGNVHCMYEDLSQAGSQWGKRTITPTAHTLTDNKVSQRFVFRKFSNGAKFCISHYHLNNHGICLNAKSGSSAQIQYLHSSLEGGSASCFLSEVMVEDDARQNQPKLSSKRFVQNLNTEGRPLAVDVTSDGSLIAMVEEIKGDHSRPSPTRVVRIYRRGQEECFASYQPADSSSSSSFPPPSLASFLPSDLIFWRSQHSGKEQLLVADYTSDSVHVLSVQVTKGHAGRCVLERCLAAGNGDLVKPTAFDTDTRGRLWIGCANGWILKCEALPEKQEDGNEDDNNRSENGKVAGNFNGEGQRSCAAPLLRVKQEVNEARLDC